MNAELEDRRHADGTFGEKMQGVPEVRLSNLGQEMSNLIFVAGRGFGRGRFGNAEKIAAAYDAAAAYVASLGQPLNQWEAEIRAEYHLLCSEFEADRDGLDKDARRTRQFEAARQASWVREAHENGER